MAEIQLIDLSSEINNWKDASCGEEVRGAGITSLEKMQEVTNKTIVQVNQTVEQVNETEQTANDAVNRANNTLNHADEVLRDATQQADNSEGSATLSRSWAVGETGTRSGEDTDNSEYYSRQAKTSAGSAKNEADRAAQYSQIVAPGFYFDPAESTLYIKAGVGVDFVTVDSVLYWKITV